MQQYDARGNPESKASRDAARRSRRALNDILATAGICVPVKDAKNFLEKRQNAIELERRNAEDFEEDIGFWLQMVDSFAQWLVGHVLTGIRLRILVSIFVTDLAVASTTDIPRRLSITASQ